MHPGAGARLERLGQRLAGDRGGRLGRPPCARARLAGGGQHEPRRIRVSGPRPRRLQLDPGRGDLRHRRWEREPGRLRHLAGPCDPSPHRRRQRPQRCPRILLECRELHRRLRSRVATLPRPGAAADPRCCPAPRWRRPTWRACRRCASSAIRARRPWRWRVAWWATRRATSSRRSATARRTGCSTPGATRRWALRAACLRHPPRTEGEPAARGAPDHGAGVPEAIDENQSRSWLARSRGRAGAVGEQGELLLLDAVLHITARAIDRLVQLASRHAIDREGGDDEARVHLPRQRPRPCAARGACGSRSSFVR